MMEARLHGMKYTYTKPNSLYELTYQEIRRALHGKNLIEEQKGGESPEKKIGGKKISRPTKQDKKVHEEFKRKHNLS